MTRNWQIYYNAIFGAIGGLLGWLIVGRFNTGEWNITLAYIFVGAGIGLTIGAMVGAVEGIIIKQSPNRAALGAALGGGAGLASGVIGLLIGEVAFLALSGGLVGRAVGWTALGLFLGLGEGVVSRQMKRASYGAIGGTAAGFLGGVIYEAMTQLFLERSETAQMIVGALGLIVIGACLGGIIPLSVDLIARATEGKGLLKVLSGKRAGLEISIIDVATLGSYDGCDLYLPGDRTIEGKQAQIGKGPQGYTIKNIGQRTPIYLNGSPLMPNGNQPLPAGAAIQIGETSLQFVVE
jgi:hypothetical protein